MRTKVTLYETYNWNNHEILILTELGRKTKQWHKEYEKYQCCTQSREAFYRKLFFKISQYSQENNCAGLFFLLKMQTFKPATLLKGDPTKLFSWQYLRKIFKNSYFEEHLWTAVSESFSFCFFPTWTNNIASYIVSEDVFSKTKQKIPF